MAEFLTNCFSKQEIKEIAVQNNIPESLQDAFREQLEFDVNDMFSDPAQVEDGNICERALAYALRYIEVYSDELQKGHGDRWAKLYAKSFYTAMGDHVEPEKYEALDFAYEELRKADKELADREATFYCLKKSRSNLFIKHFLHLLNGAGEGFEDAETKAATYERVYNEQLAAGKSELFAHEYADIVADDTYRESYAYAYAWAYEQASNEGRSDEYVTEYAYKVADYVGDNFSSFEKAAGLWDFQIEMDKINAFMQGKAYALQHNLKDPSRFAEWYSDEYVQVLYPTKQRITSSEEDVEAIVLKRLREKYRRLFD